MTQKRSELLAAISDLCERYPHWRFGQLVANVADWTGRGVWDAEDDQLLEASRRHLERLPHDVDEVPIPHRR